MGKRNKIEFCEAIFSLKQIRLLHWCFKNCKISISQDKMVFEWQQQHLAITPYELNCVWLYHHGRRKGKFFMTSTLENWNFWKRVRVSLYRVQKGGKRLFTFNKPKRLGFLRLLGFWKGLNSFTLFNVFTQFSNNSPHEWN